MDGHWSSGPFTDNSRLAEMGSKHELKTAGTIPGLRKFAPKTVEGVVALEGQGVWTTRTDCILGICSCMSDIMNLDVGRSALSAEGVGKYRSSENPQLPRWR